MHVVFTFLREPYKI